MNALSDKLLALLFALILFQCKTDPTNLATSHPGSYSWGTPTNTVIENGYFHSKKSLDTLGNQLVGDTLIPVLIQDSKMVIEKLEPLQMEMKIIDGIEDFYITRIGYKKDTFDFEIKTLIGKSFLILFSRTSSSQVYILKDENIILTETQNTIFPDYKVGGYAVGDVIIRDDIQVVSKDQFGTIITEEAIHIDNENIYFKVIGSRYIEEIRWLNIYDGEKEKIIKEINSKFMNPPSIEYIHDAQGNETEVIASYFWFENEVSVLLSRTTEFGELDKSWTLTYNNLIVSNILNNFLDPETENL
jgi:hypothetical protein